MIQKNYLLSSLLLNILLVTIIFNVKIEAQSLFNNGGHIISNSGSYVYVNGTVKNTSGTIDNEGTYYITGGVTNDNLSYIKGSGEIQLRRDWINYGTFSPDTSHVRFIGSNQNITGDTVTQFYNLSFENSGVKTLLISAEVVNYLNLNNLELAVEDDTIFVLNNNPSAILYDTTFSAEGFVSNNLTGRLYREQLAGFSYIYPMANQLPVYRFRSVETNQSANDGVFVGFINNDPANDGLTVLSSDICNVNSNFYHLISSSSGNTPGNVTINYLNSDGTYVGKANYTTQWDKVQNTSTGTNGNFNTMSTSSYNLWSNEPLVLANFTPVGTILGDSVICGVQTVLYTVNDTNTNYSYNWTVSNGLISSQNGNSVEVGFNSNNNGFITVSILDTITGCSSSNNDTIFVSIGQLPDTTIILSDTTLLTGDIVDVSNPGVNVDQWNWSVDGYNNTNQDFQYFFNDTGYYEVNLVVTNNSGCTDTSSVVIHVMEDLVLPNIFTPNGDGTNDFFKPISSGYDEYTLVIFNRWGQQLYSGDKASRGWDGKTISGKEAPEGDYFYIFTAGEIVHKGNLFLNR